MSGALETRGEQTPRPAPVAHAVDQDERAHRRIDCRIGVLLLRHVRPVHRGRGTFIVNVHGRHDGLTIAQETAPAQMLNPHIFRAYDVRGRVVHESIFNRNDGNYRCPSSQQGYTPFSTWTRETWLGAAWDVLLDRRSKERGIIDPVAVAGLLTEHATGHIDGGDRIVWVAGYGIDEGFRVTDPTQAVVIFRVVPLGGPA